jgi:hypothetical protein
MAQVVGPCLASASSNTSTTKTKLMRMVDLKTKIWPGDVAQWLSVCLACTRPCIQSPVLYNK